MASAAPAEAHSLNAQVAVVLGTQWGDEGKGKLVDILAQQYDIVARAQVYSSPLVHPKMTTLEAFTKTLKKFSKCDPEMHGSSTLRASRNVCSGRCMLEKIRVVVHRASTCRLHTILRPVRDDTGCFWLPHFQGLRQTVVFRGAAISSHMRQQLKGVCAAFGALRHAKQERLMWIYHCHGALNILLVR